MVARDRQSPPRVLARDCYCGAAVAAFISHVFFLSCLSYLLYILSRIIGVPGLENTPRYNPMLTQQIMLEGPGE